LIEELARWDREGLVHPNLVVCPHENVAMHMAAGYAAVTGKGQAVMVHVDAGTTAGSYAVSYTFSYTGGTNAVPCEATTTINGLVSTDEYDAATRTTSVTSAGGKVSSRVFDAKSRIISNKAPDIDPVTVAYDAQGRQTTAAHGTRAVTFTYDAKSRLATETNPVGTVTTYVYDSADRVVSLTRAGQTWQFGSDVRGNRTSVTMPSGAVHQFAFDTRNLQTSYTAPGTASRTSAYSADGDPTSTVWPGGGAVATTYDGGGRQTGRAQPGGVAAFGWAGTTDRMASESGTTAAGTAQAAFGFDGGATTSTDWTGTATGSFDYAYDKNDWLTSLSLTTGADTVVVRWPARRRCAHLGGAVHLHTRRSGRSPVERERRDRFADRGIQQLRRTRRS
jgi:YD repeat-containing protein